MKDINMLCRKLFRKYRIYGIIGACFLLVGMQMYLYCSTGRELEYPLLRSSRGAGPQDLPNDFPYLVAKLPQQDDHQLSELSSKKHFQKSFRRSRFTKPAEFNISNASTVSQKCDNPPCSTILHPILSNECGNLSKDSQSAFDRAQSNECKAKIAQTACLHQKRQLYPQTLSRRCPLAGKEYGNFVGCFKDDSKKRILPDHVTEFRDRNSPMICVNHCLRSGFEYSGVQYGYECFCGTSLKTNEAKPLPRSLCNYRCPTHRNLTCGGNFAIEVYRTGFGSKLLHPADYVSKDDKTLKDKVRIVFVLTVTGRALRQVKRLLKAIYRSHHFYYIHVDSRQEYLFRELSKLSETLPNIRMAPVRFSTIWGGASLLEMLIQCMTDLLTFEDWNWDYVLNLSESDYPVKTIEELEAFLTKHAGMNFLKSHGKDTPRFMKRQGLDMLFLECDNHMWRLGTRDVQDGIRIDGGSDWICLHRKFADYVVRGSDDLLNGLKAYWKYTLLPAESFFHTVLQNTEFCTSFVNNNLHLTNWRRKQGCKCQYKHIVDWCGCSPNDLLPEDLNKIQSIKKKTDYFARKFEAIVNQEIINDVDTYVLDRHLSGDVSTESFWLNVFHHEDVETTFDDTSYTFFDSFARITLDRVATDANCSFTFVKMLEGTIYKHRDTLQGLIVTFEGRNPVYNISFVFESLFQPTLLRHDVHLKGPLARLKSVEVGTNYDPKEELFRNFGSLMGVHSDVTVRFEWDIGREVIMTIAFVDPANELAASYDITAADRSFIHTHQPNLRKPLRPGIWSIKLIYSWQIMTEIRFLVLPYSRYQNAVITPAMAATLHDGPGGLPYVDQDFGSLKNIMHLENAVFLSKQAKQNSVKTGKRLLKWIDNLVQSWWMHSEACLETSSISCSKLPACESVRWSTRFPDPKSEISAVDTKTGMLR